MVTYGDYFSRKTLHNCGISPNEKMFEKDEKAYTGMQRTEKIRSEIEKVYQNLYRGFTENGAGKAKDDFANFHVERKIVAAFYDTGVLTNAERDYFQAQTLGNFSEREKICVEEANTLMEAPKAQRVEAPMKISSVRNIRQ
jgi:hypothetical protein